MTGVREERKTASDHSSSATVSHLGPPKSWEFDGDGR